MNYFISDVISCSDNYLLQRVGKDITQVVRWIFNPSLAKLT
ncbi:MAG: hypothetical protein ABF249_02385 [Flavobacteriales bacterium]